MAKRAYLECGRINAPHGIRGALSVSSFCDTPAVLASLPCVYFLENGQYLPRRVLRASVGGGSVLMTLDGVSDRNAADLLRGKTIYADRNDIPIEEGAALIADMIGLPVRHADSGELLGHLREVTDSPASQLYRIEAEDGRTVLLPAVPAFVIRIDTADAIYIRPIPGFFDEGESV